MVDIKVKKNKYFQSYINKPKANRILIVDDEPFNVMGMKILLQQYAFKGIVNIIDVAYNGVDAFNLVKNSYLNHN